MRFFQNLSIAMKLALSTFITLALLTALGLRAHVDIARLADIQARTSASVAGIERVSQARRAATELRVISREIADEPTVAGLDALVGRAETQAGLARVALTADPDGEPGGEPGDEPDSADFSAARAGIDAVASAIKTEAAGRRPALAVNTGVSNAPELLAPVEQASADLREHLRRVTAIETARAERARNDAAAAAAAQWSVMLIGCGIGVVLLVSGFLTSRAIARPIGAMTRAARSLAAGDTDASFGHTGRRDEIGRMADALETLRDVVREAFVRGQMIEQSPSGMMSARTETDGFAITYVNPAAIAIMERVREHLPAAPDQFLGRSLVDLTAASGESRALLSDPGRLPRTLRLALGEETLDMVVSALRDRTGAYIGPMATWRRVTEQVNLRHRFEATVDVIGRGVATQAAAMTESAERMNHATDEAGARIAIVARVSESVTAKVAIRAAAAEELAASINEIGRQVSESARIAGHAVEEAAATDRCVGGLSEAAQRIDDVVRLIGDIAGRTNLLALNATIEAARAGDAGKGFAVVASEVKNLAAQTARATEEIGAQIAAMQAASQQAVEALRSIGATIGRMSEIATTIAGAVDQQSAATRAIAQAVQEAADGTSETISTIALMTADIGRTGTEAEQVRRIAGDLARQSDALHAESGAFHAAVQRAA